MVPPQLTSRLGFINSYPVPWFFGFRSTLRGGRFSVVRSRSINVASTLWRCLGAVGRCFSMGVKHVATR